MQKINFSITLLVCFSLGVLTTLAIELPKWYSTYKVGGTLYIPHSEIAEPFFAWYDSTTSRSRIDYYDGMTKTLQLAGEGNFGKSYKFTPVSNHEELNEMTCFYQYGDIHRPIKMQPVLPETNGFSFIGKVSFLGFTCDKFQMKEILENGKKILTLWVRYKESPQYPNTSMPIPVRFEIRVYDTLGSLTSHSYLDYHSYEHADIPDEVFHTLTKKFFCTGYADNDTNAHVSFNPMQIYVHPTVDHHLNDEFEHFKDKHGITYKSQSEHDYRKNIFKQNLHYIHSMNRAKLSYKLAVNHLADQTDDELIARRGYRYSGGYNTGKPFPYNVNKLRNLLPDQYDWRLHGAVTPVKDQSVCGSCWSFGAIGHIEGAYFLKNGGKLMRLSEQALVDCSWQYKNKGCDGGNPLSAYLWIMEVGGVPTEEEYGPYLAQNGYCHIQNLTLVAPIKGFVIITPGDPNALKIALLKHGPIAITINVSPKSFNFYSHGVYYDKSCKNDTSALNHAVLAVGYGTIGGEDYWLVKNSWSSYWGNDGYILIAARDNNCGVMTMATYVEM